VTRSTASARVVFWRNDRGLTAYVPLMGSHLLFLIVALSACIRTNPARGLSPADGPARLKIVHTSGIYVDIDGNRRREVTTAWDYQQGSAPVDEQDWWMLKDPRVSEEIRRGREGLIRRQRIGRGLMFGGYAAVALVPVGLVVGGVEGKAMVISGGVIGFIAATIGHTIYGLNGGWDPHEISLDRAKAVADEIEECHDDRCRIDSKRRLTPRRTTYGRR
jgi:hypothetical protein